MKSTKEFRMYTYNKQYVYWVITFFKKGMPKFRLVQFFEPYEAVKYPNVIGYSGDNYYWLKTFPVAYA